MTEPSSEDWIRLGGPISRLSVSLRVAGDGLDPTEISRLLGVAPTFAARKGDQIEHGPRIRTQRVSIWTYGLTEEPSPEWELDDAISALLNRLPRDSAVWADLASRFSINIFCGLFMGSDNQGAVLRTSTLQSLAERHLELDLDVYGPPDGDEA